MRSSHGLLVVLMTRRPRDSLRDKSGSRGRCTMFMGKSGQGQFSCDLIGQESWDFSDWLVEKVHFLGHLQYFCLKVQICVVGCMGNI